MSATWLTGHRTNARACMASSSRPSVSAAHANMSPHGSQPATATLNAFSLAAIRLSL